MKKSLVFFALLGTLAAGAQPNSVIPKNIRAANTLDNLTDGLSTSDNLYGIPLEPGRVVGSSYLNSGWKRTTILLYDVAKMIEGYDTRYEIDTDQFEIRTRTGVKVLNGKKVKSFVWVDSLTNTPQYFVNARDYKDEANGSRNGFYEVLAEGALTLLSGTNIVVREPTYNEKLDIGNRDTRIIRRTTFYYLDDGVVKELPSSKKKLLPLFGEHSTTAEEFIRLNKLSLNQPGHLRALFEHYNRRIVTN